MITCGWCHTNYAQWKTNCDNCGGPMPPLPGMELGSAPPPPPRVLPKHFEFRLKWSRNIGVIAGLGMMVISALMLTAMIKVKTWAAFVPGIFLLLGFGAFRYGRNSAISTLRAFRHGVAAEGRVADVSVDKTQSVNGRHPWRLVYTFVAAGQPCEGILTSFDSSLAARSRGQPLWVLHLPEDPEVCTIYPPVK